MKVAKITIDVVDLSKEREIVHFIDQLKKNFLPDILINNAGYCWQGSLDTMNMENLERVFTLNTIAPFSLILKLLPSMKQQQWGRIINISSISTTKIHQNLIAYSASKITLETISEGIHLDANNAGITCNAILPGLMLTKMGITSIRKAYPSYKTPHNRSNQEIELTLMKQLNTKERTAISDICKLVQFLISDRGGLVSGESLSCNSRYWP